MYIILSIISLIFALIGSLIIAFRLRILINMIIVAITAHENSIASFAQFVQGNGNAHYVTGFDTQFVNIIRRIRIRTMIGLIMIFLGFLIQIINLLIQLFYQGCR